jgi:hypothetical protein
VWEGRGLSNSCSAAVAAAAAAAGGLCVKDSRMGDGHTLPTYSGLWAGLGLCFLGGGGKRKPDNN